MVWALRSFVVLAMGVFGGGTGARRKSGLGIGGRDFAGSVLSFGEGAVGVSASNTAGLRMKVG